MPCLSSVVSYLCESVCFQNAVAAGQADDEDEDEEAEDMEEWEESGKLQEDDPVRSLFMISMKLVLPSHFIS